MKITQGDRYAIIIIFVLAPVTGVAVSWALAACVLAAGLLVALLASAGAVAQQTAAARRPVGEGDRPQAARDLPVHRGTLAEPDDQPTSW